jgi:hypothetical protein
LSGKNNKKLKKEELSSEILRQNEINKKKEEEAIKNKIITQDKIKELAGKLDILEEKQEKRLNLRESILKRSGKYQI